MRRSFFAAAVVLASCSPTVYVDKLVRTMPPPRNAGMEFATFSEGQQPECPYDVIAAMSSPRRRWYEAYEHVEAFADKALELGADGMILTASTHSQSAVAGYNTVTKTAYILPVDRSAMSAQAIVWRDRGCKH